MSTRPRIVDLTLDDDDEPSDVRRRQVTVPSGVITLDDDDEYAQLPTAAAVTEPPPLIEPLPPAPLAEPPRLEVITQPIVEVAEAQLGVVPSTTTTTTTAATSFERVQLAPITDVPSFRAARDDSLQSNDTLNVRRLMAHAVALETRDTSTVGANRPSPPVRRTPVETLVLLEQVSPLAINLRTQCEHGDEFQYSDTFAFVARSDDADAELDAGAYQHSFAFTAGRYEVAPPIAALGAAGLFDVNPVPRTVTRSEIWRDYELNTTRALLGARGSGGLPTLFFEAALASPTLTIADDQFVPLYRAIERRGGTRFSAEVLDQTIDDVRAATSSRATQPRSAERLGKSIGGQVDESSDEGDEDSSERERQVYDSDGEELPTLDEQAVRTLEHIRALLSYESVLLERQGVWRSRVGASADTDGLYIVDDRVREYRLSAEDECYEFEYDSYIAFDADEYETLEARIRFVPRGVAVPHSALPRSFYERLEIDETMRLGVKSMSAQTRAPRRPNVKNVLKQQADPSSERANGVESPARLNARPGAGRIATLAEDELVDIVDSEGKKRTYDEAASESPQAPTTTEQEEEQAEAAEDEDADEDVAELGSDQESLASDADLETMQRTLEEEAFGDLNLDETIARDSSARLDPRYSTTTIAVPLGWDRSAALATVRAAYEQGDPLDEDTPWWRTDDAVWTAIVELALYEKLVPCFGPAFPEEARETLGLALELIHRRINAENAFLAANRSNWEQLLRQRREAEQTVLAPLIAERQRAADAERRAYERGEVELALQEGERRRAADESIRRATPKTRAMTLDANAPPLDTQPVLLRICVPDSAVAFAFLPFIDVEREPLAHIYALAGQRPALDAVDEYAAVPLRVERGECADESQYFPFASQYGTRESIEKLFNASGAADEARTVAAVGALRAYITSTRRTPEAADAALARFRTVEPRELGSRLYELYVADEQAEQVELAAEALRRRGARAAATVVTRSFIEAVYPAVAVHNRVKPVFLAPPRLARLSALRRAVQGPLFEEAFGVIGRFDAGTLARVSALKDAERARRAREQLENRGAERLFANAAALYAADHSSPYGAYVVDSAPRVRTHFRLQPPDLSLPEGVYRAFEGRALVDGEATLRLLKSRVSIGGSRVQQASLEREFAVDPAEGANDRAPFLLLCAPEIGLAIVAAVLNDTRVDVSVAAELRSFLAEVSERPLLSLATYRAYYTQCAALFGKLERLCVVRELSRDIVVQQTRAEFVTAAVESLLRRELLVLPTRPTAPDRLVTLPMSGMAALARADDAPRIALRSQLFEIYYRLAIDLRFKRQGYLTTPFNTSTTLQLPTNGDYDNYYTLYLALTRVLRAVDANDDDDVDAMLSDESASAEVNERLRRTGALELRTLRNTIEREIEQLHAARTMWFELTALVADPDAFARQVVDELVSLYTAVTTSRVAVVEPFERRETDTAARPPLALDVRATQLVPHALTPVVVNGVPLEAVADLDAAGERFTDFEVLIDAVQDAADRGESLEPLLRAPEKPAAAAQTPAAAAGRSVNRLDVLLGGGAPPPPPSQREQPVKRAATEVDRLRARLVRLARLDAAALEAARAVEDEQRVANEIFNQQTAQRTANAVATQRANGLDEPHGSHKRATIAGVNKAASIAADVGQLTSRQTAIKEQFEHSSSSAALAESLDEMYTLLTRIAGATSNEDDGSSEEAPAPSAASAPRKVRLVNAVSVVLGRLLDRVGSDLIGARLRQRRAALDALGVVSRAGASASVDTQIAVVQRLLAEQPARGAAITRVGQRRLSQFDVLTSRLLASDVRRVLDWLQAQSLLRALPERVFSVRRGAFTREVRVPGIYATLLLPAAVERARLQLQYTLETAGLRESIASNTSERPYAVAHRADAHPSLRIDELVRRYALLGEVPLDARNSRYTPYAQFAQPALVSGRLVDEPTQLAAFETRFTLSEQHVAFNEGAHRTHASAADTLLAALMMHLMQLFGALHQLDTLAQVYERSRRTVDETRTFSSAVEPRLRLGHFLEMFFAGRMPSLEHMRPTDMRLLALVLLGFDTTSRIDNDLDNNPAEPDDSPVTTPAYVHMRSNTAKRVLVDAYCRAVLRQLHHPEGATNRALQIDIVGKEGEPRWRVVEHERRARRTPDGVVRGEEFRLVLTHDEHAARYEDNLEFAKLRAVDIDAIGIDRTLIGLNGVAEQIASLGPRDGRVYRLVERQLVLAGLPRPMPRDFATPTLSDQAWLLVPRVTLVGALITHFPDLRTEVLDALEKIIVTLDDSAHLLATDTTDDALQLFAEQADELEATEEQPETPTGGSATPTTPAEKKKKKAKTVVAVQRNPITAAGNFDEWRVSVDDALKRILRVERATLGGTFGRTAQRLLEYEVTATTSFDSAARFYAALAPALVLARFIVEDGIDIGDAERVPTPGYEELSAIFASPEVRAARRTLSDTQFELAKILVAAELGRRVVWRPNAEGTALLTGAQRGQSVVEAYRNDADAAPTVALFGALADALNGNKKRSAKAVLTDYLAARRDVLRIATSRQVRLVQMFLETTKQVRYDAVERYVPLYDAVQLLLKPSFDIGTESDGALVTSEQLHPLVDVLAAPLTGRWYLRLSTEPFPAESLTACRTALINVYAPRFASAYSLVETRLALDSVTLSREQVVVVHEFVYATPAAPPPSDDDGPKTNKRQGHNYVQVNRVDWSEGAASLRDLLGDNYSPLTLVGNDRFRQLLPLIGMPLATTTNE